MTAFIKDAKVGDFVNFGNYPQSVSEDVQPIEWQVLAKEDNKILVISHYGLEAKRFDSSSNNWKNSEIRKWLNSDFYNNAFNEDEKKYISRKFLLSEEEAEKYFVNDDARKCKPTEYAIKNGAYVADDGCGIWLLSSPAPGHYVYGVDYTGYFRYYCKVNYDINLVRPALWIKL